MPTTVSGNIKDLSSTAVTSGSFIRFQLRGTTGTQPRVSGTALIAQGVGTGQGYFFDFNPDANGNISGTLYSTRDATGLLGGDIETGGVTTAVWYEMSLWRNGKKLSSIHCHAKNGATLNISTVTPISTSPIATAPTGDTVYARLDGGNQPFIAGITAPALTSTGTLSVAGISSLKNLAQVRYADQFTGADMGAKITAAIADLPGTGGIVDARAFQGAQAAAATITVTQGITVLLGGVTLTLAGSPGINLAGQGAGIIGLGIAVTILQTSSGTADIIQTNNNFNFAFGCSCVSSVARTGGAGLRCKGGNGMFENLTIDKTFNGISIIDSLSGASAGNKFNNITMGFGLASSGSWNTGIKLGGVASGTVTSEVFKNVNIEGSTAFAGFMVELDSGCDTIDFENCQFVQVGLGDSQCLVIHNTSTSNDPQWIKFTDCTFEAGTTKEAVGISQGILVNFEGCQHATSKVAYDFSGGKAITVRDNKIVGMQNEGIIISGGKNIRIAGCRISDCSEAANGGANSIAIAANVTDFAIEGNDFTTVISAANQPFQNIVVNAGTSDRYWITGNTFANFTSAGLNDGGTGTNKLVGFNSPFSAGSTSLYGLTLTQASSLNKVTLIDSQDAAAALTGDTTDKPFYTLTLPAALLAAGKGIKVSAFWIHGTGTASVTYKLFFGATAVINTSSAVTGNGCMEAIIMNRPASTTAQRASGKLTPTGTASVVFSGITPAENTANAVVVKATFNVAATDQVTPAQWLVELIQ